MTPEQQVIALAGFIGSALLTALRIIWAKLEKCEAREDERNETTRKLAEALQQQVAALEAEKRLHAGPTA